MTNLISGKEALIALANGKEVENFNGSAWWSVDESWEVGAFLSDRKFRLKPRTIRLNGIEVPAPFEPKIKDVFYYLDGAHAEGFSWRKMHDDTPPWFFENPVWRTEEEIKQVVSALRQVFGASQ